MFKLITSLFFILFLVACGSQQQMVSGIEENSQLILRGDNLIGLKIRVGSSFSMIIDKDDLTPYRSGILGARDSENERLQAVTLKVDQGQQQVVVSQAGVVFHSKSMYFGAGQTREVKIQQ